MDLRFKSTVTAESVVARGFMKPRGLSLIEVLIAATILFAALAVVSDGYRSSVTAGQRAATAAELVTPLPVILGVVKRQLFDQLSDRVTGSGEFLGVDYRFSADSLSFSPPPAGYDFSSDSERIFKPRYRLYSVELVLSKGSATRKLVYRELAWSREIQ